VVVAEVIFVARQYSGKDARSHQRFHLGRAESQESASSATSKPSEGIMRHRRPRLERVTASPPGLRQS
jgi:hypothetical protein